jgi:hypothetical protein
LRGEASSKIGRSKTYRHRKEPQAGRQADRKVGK